MTQSSPYQSCPYSPHSGPVECLPAPNIFPKAKETFAKGKMVWNILEPGKNRKCLIYERRCKKSLCLFVCGEGYEYQLFVEPF